MQTRPISQSGNDDAKIKKLSTASFAAMLVAASIQGDAQNIDCLFCHAPNGASGVMDFSQYYIHPEDGHPIGHGYHFNHPVGQKYPAGLNATKKTNCSVRPKTRRRNVLHACQDDREYKFKPTNRRIADIEFFDKNGNGLPDSDEVQLFAETDDVSGEIIVENGDVTVRCSSCHKAHGNDPASGSTPDHSYLRIKTKASELCLTCHNK